MKKCKVLDAVVAGKRNGELVELDDAQADYLATIKYVEIVEDVSRETITADAEKPKPKNTRKKAEK